MLKEVLLIKKRGKESMKTVKVGFVGTVYTTVDKKVKIAMHQNKYMEVFPNETRY